jgi:hypothetical protein
MTIRKRHHPCRSLYACANLLRPDRVKFTVCAATGHLLYLDWVYGAH